MARPGEDDTTRLASDAYSPAGYVGYGSKEFRDRIALELAARKRAPIKNIGEGIYSAASDFNEYMAEKRALEVGAAQRAYENSQLRNAAQMANGERTAGQPAVPAQPAAPAVPAPAATPAPAPAATPAPAPAATPPPAPAPMPELPRADYYPTTPDTEPLTAPALARRQAIANAIRDTALRRMQTGDTAADRPVLPVVPPPDPNVAMDEQQPNLRDRYSSFNEASDTPGPTPQPQSGLAQEDRPIRLAAASGFPAPDTLPPP